MAGKKAGMQAYPMKMQRPKNISMTFFRKTPRNDVLGRFLIVAELSGFREK